MEGERFTVAHVMQHGSLREVATRYVEQWQGDYPFLLAAKKVVERGETLLAPAVKGVLNCMLHDPNVVNLSVPAPVRFDADLGYNVKDGTASAGSTDSLPEFQYEYAASFPRRIRLSTKWRKPFVISRAHNAKLIHYLNASASHLAYFTATEDRESRFQWHPELNCDTMFWMKRTEKKGLSDRYYMINEAEADILISIGCAFREIPARKWKWCFRCQETYRLER